MLFFLLISSIPSVPLSSHRLLSSALLPSLLFLFSPHPHYFLLISPLLGLNQVSISFVLYFILSSVIHLSLILCSPVPYLFFFSYPLIFSFSFLPCLLLSPFFCSFSNLQLELQNMGFFTNTCFKTHSFCHLHTHRDMFISILKCRVGCSDGVLRMNSK